MQLADYSHLKAPPGEKLTIPLNGVNYHAVVDPPADVVLSAAQHDAGSDGLADLPTGVSLEQLASDDPVIAAKLQRTEASGLVRIMRFFEDVLEPDSYDRWKTNMRRPDKGLTPAKRQQHAERMITFPQLLAVFKDLVGHYSGRPTAPSSPSQNGDDGTGGTSTETAPDAG